MSIVPYKFIDPDLLLDKYHPDNQHFVQTNRRLQKQIVAISARCRPNHIDVAKHHVRGSRNVDISNDLNMGQVSVSAILKRPEIQELIEYLRWYESHQEGLSIAHRKHMLTKIAIDNIDEDPRVTTTAIKEVNLMEGVGKEKQDTNINITFNNQQFPRGALD